MIYVFLVGVELPQNHGDCERVLQITLCFLTLYTETIKKATLYVYHTV